MTPPQFRSLWAFLLLLAIHAHPSAQEGRPRREPFGGPMGGSEVVNWEERRKTLMGKFDVDGDGFLSATEREAMRKARFQQAPSGGGRGGFRMMMPPEVVKKYDKDGNGELNEAETQEAMMGIRKQMEEITRDYDTNKDGRLEGPELERVRSDIDAGKIVGVPRFFFNGGGRGGRGGRGGPWGGGGAEPEPRFVAADKNKDGRLSADELQAVRNSNPSPSSSK